MLLLFFSSEKQKNDFTLIMGCGASAASSMRMEDVKMRKINRPLQAHEKAVVERIFSSLDDDASNEVSDDELRDLFQKFGFDIRPQCIKHVGECLRTWESSRVNRNSKKGVIDQSTFEQWWPSILDYFERISLCVGELRATGEEGFDLLLQPFQDAGFGPCLCEDAPLAVDKIVQMCYELGVRFRDSTFTPGDHSIGTKLEKKTTWKRISDFVGAKALMFADGTSAGDTVCETYGLNKYAADITSLADRFDLLMTAVYPPRYSPTGIYAVRLLRDGHTVFVIVDDYIPVDSNNVPAFLRSADPKEIWTLIIDKAFAKLKGSYEKLHLSANLLLDPLSLLSGSRPSTLAAPRGMSSADRIEMMWSCICLYMDKHWFMCSSPVSAEKSSGLILDHSYSVIGYAEDESQRVRLVQVRNPMGTVEWKGAWSDGDEAWKNHPKMAKRCLANQEDDGGFWISIEDFTTRFGSLRCNALLPRGTIPLEEFEDFGRNMTWATTEMAWREAHLLLEEKKKIREEMTSVQKFISTHVGEVILDGQPVMTPFDCPQYKIVVPTGSTATFYYRACRVMDADADGVDDDEEFDSLGEFDAWKFLSREALQTELPYVWIVRGDGRQTVLPTKHIISSSFSSYTRCTLAAGSYVLMMMAFDRPDVPLKLMIRMPSTAGKGFSIKEISPCQNITWIHSTPESEIKGLERYMPTGNASLDSKRPPFHEISPFLQISPSGTAVKNMTLVLIIAPRHEAMNNRAGKLLLTTLRSTLSAPFSWDSVSGKSDINSSRTMRTLYYTGTGQDFFALPMLTGECIGINGKATTVPYVVAVWSGLGKVNITLGNK